MMQKIKISPLDFKDLKKVAKIEKSCFGSSALSETALENSFKNDIYFFVCAKVNDEVVGYGGMYRVLTEGYVLNIAVDKKFRKMKIGTMITQNLIYYSKNKGLEFLSLEVRESNTAAINLYEKLGFKNLGLRKNFYEKPKENAIIMTHYLK